MRHPLDNSRYDPTLGAEKNEQGGGLFVLGKSVVLSIIPVGRTPLGRCGYDMRESV